MDIKIHPASLTAPGICHNLDIGGHPSAQEVTLDTGTPTGHLTIGCLDTGQLVTVNCPSLAWLDELARAISTERSRLAMFLPRLDVHPLGDMT